MKMKSRKGIPQRLLTICLILCLLNYLQYIGGNETAKTYASINNTFISVFEGYNYTFGIKSDGSLWAWGCNDAFQLGDGTNYTYLSPKKIISSGVKKIATGFQNTYAIMTDGSLWAWGENSHGQCGDGTVVQIKTPKKIMANGVKDVYSNIMGSHVLILLTDNSLWGCGWNQYGQVGDGTLVDSRIPTKILEGAKNAACGTVTSYAVYTDGSLWGWGHAQLGSLGNGTIYKDYTSPIPIISDSVVSVYAGDRRVHVIKTDSSLWGWGYNFYGSVGIGSANESVLYPQYITSSVSSVSEGYTFTVIVKNDGSYWGFGSNAAGQLGNGLSGNGITFLSPEKIIESGCSQVAAGKEQALIVKADGSIWACGRNQYGAFGNGTNIDSIVPVLVFNGQITPTYTPVATISPSVSPPNPSPTLSPQNSPTPTSAINDNIPIIILPGIMGSNLYKGTISSSNRIWIPDLKSVDMLDTGMNMSIANALNMNPPFNLVPKSTTEREYGAIDIYKKLVDRLCSEFPYRKVYFFSYDFRQSNIESAKKLKDFVDNTLQCEKVDLVCHSMGGIVAAQYAVLDKTKIDKVITLGTPYEGSPRMLDSILNWNVMKKDNDFSSMFGDIFLGMTGLTKSLKSSFPSAAELFPSIAYLGQVETYVGTIIAPFDRVASETDINKLKSVLFADNASNYNNSARMRMADDGTNILASLDQSYFGIGVGIRTLSSFSIGLADNLTELEILRTLYRNDGDGTVPYLSATMMGRLLNKVGINGRVRYFNGVDHTALTSNSETLNWVVSILKGQSDLSDTIPPKVGKPYVIIAAACPVNIKISGSNGTLDSTEKSPSKKSAFGSISFSGLDSDIKIIDIDDDQLYSVNLVGIGTGVMTYSIAWYDENNSLIDYREVKNVPIQSGTLISTGTDKNTDTTLKIDPDVTGKPKMVVTVLSNKSALPTASITPSPGPTSSEPINTVPVVLLGNQAIILIISFVGGLLLVVTVLIFIRRRSNKRLFK